MSERSDTRRAVRGALLVVAACLVAVCGWSAWTYAQGGDPLAFLDSAAFETVAEEPADDAASVEQDEEDAAAEEAAAEEGASSGDASAPADETGASETPTSSGGNGGSTSSATPAPTATISVSVTIDASAAGGSISSSTVSLSSGATAYDGLLATGAGVNARATAYGTYVAAINGLAEFDHGGMSGWVYAVNGTEPNAACSAYALSDGDALVWRYVNVEE